MDGFESAERFAIDIANCTLGNYNDKLMTKNHVLNMIALCCKLYSVNDDFKKQIDGYMIYKGLSK